MKLLAGNCLVAQSGGPTTVINSSAYGVITEFLKLSNGIAYAGVYGTEGILSRKIFDVGKVNKKTLKGMKYLPSSALGSCRYKLKDFKEDPLEYELLFEIFREFNIKYFFYIGGNDSMDAASKLYEYGKLKDYDIKIIGIPKTIDNDLVVTDHCPGFGSSAKYASNVVMEMWFDTNTYNNSSIAVVEVMGRDTGWIAASTGIIKDSIDDINQLILIPEIPFEKTDFLNKVAKAYSINNKLIVVTSEGLKDNKGDYLSTQNEKDKGDQFGHTQLGGIGVYLQNLIINNIDKRTKFIELGISQRCAMHCASKTDLNEAMFVGKMAVKYASKGSSGYMVALDRKSEKPYICKSKLVPLKDVCNKEKYVPRDWMNEEGTNVNEKMLQYIKPLIKGEVNSFGENGLLKYVKFERKV
ncbi:MAG TPA: 6-phosphofructokinase [Clostridiaceae bacterium]